MGYLIFLKKADQSGWNHFGHRTLHYIDDEKWINIPIEFEDNDKNISFNKMILKRYYCKNVLKKVFQQYNIIISVHTRGCFADNILNINDAN